MATRRAVSDTWAAGAVFAAVVGSALLVLPASFDPVEMPKVTVIWLTGVAGLGILAYAVWVEGTRPQIGIPVWAALTFIGGAAIATAFSATPALSVVGAYRRFSGFALYAAGLVLFLLVAWLFGKHAISRLLEVMVGVGGVVGAYALLQRLGLDPLPWDVIYAESSFATLGNPNFLAGYLGVTFSAAVWLVLRARRTGVSRIVGGAVTVLAIAGIWASGSLQGFLAAGTGGTTILFCFAVRQYPRRRGQIRGGISALAGGALLALVVGLLGRGPAATLLDQSLELRRYYWRAALSMFRSSPVLGVGFDRYGAHFRAHRPLEAARAVDVTFSADSAHNVPLQILAGGGLVAGATYLAFVGVVAVLLVKGLRRLDGDAYLLLAGVGGCWVAYHSQALVSIDVPPLAALHWVLAGAVVALAQPSLLAKPGSAGGKRRGRRIPSGAVPAVLVPLVLVVMWLATVPQRAELRAGTAARLAAAGQHAAAVQRYEEAASTWDSAAIYWTELGYSSQQLQDGEAALQAFGAALDRDGRAIEPAISAGRTAAALGLREQAVRWYATAKDIDPHHPAVAVEYGRALLAAGNLEGAAEEAKAALVVDPNYQDAAELLQQARMGP